MPRYVNASPHTRTWNHLRNAETGATLELAPGEDAEVDVPDDFEDQYLVPVKARKQHQGAAETKALAAEPEKE